jgi:hypothetical protein
MKRPDLSLSVRFVRCIASAALLTVCVAVLSLGHTDRAAGEERNISVRFAAEIGDKASIVIRRSRAPIQVGGSKDQLTLITTYAMEVTGKDADGYRILWTPQSLEIEGAPDDAAAKLKATLAPVMIPVEFDADASGMPIKIADRERALRMAIDALGKLGSNIDRGVVAQVRSMFASMDERTLALIFAKEAAILAKWQQADLVVGTSNEFEETRPNPFGGGPINGTVKATVTSPAAETIKIDWRTEIDPAMLLQDMIAFLKQMASRAGRSPDEVDAQLAGARLTFEESGVAEVNTSDGWTRAASLTRNIRIQSPSRSENRDEFFDIKLTRKG